MPEPQESNEISQNLQTLPEALVPFVYDYTNDRVRLLLASIQRLQGRQVPLVALSGVLLKIGYDLPESKLKIVCSLASLLGLVLGAIGLAYRPGVDIVLPRTLIDPKYSSDGEASLKKVIIRQWLEESEPQALRTIKVKGLLLNISIGLSALSGLISAIEIFASS
jgi:hypothetical protein